MILLDTNVISEITRPKADEQVLQWMDNIRGAPSFISTTTESEIRTGIALMPEGKRRTELAAAFHQLITTIYANHILVFDSKAAIAYAAIFAARRKQGQPIARADCEIAAIAHVHRLTLATRNSKDFEHCGVPLINPWNE